MFLGLTSFIRWKR